MKHPYRRAAAVFVIVFMLFVIYEQFMVGGFKFFKQSPVQVTEIDTSIDNADSQAVGVLYDEVDRWDLGPNNTTDEKFLRLVSMDVVSTGEVYAKDIMDVTGKTVIGKALVLKTTLKNVADSPTVEFAVQFIPAGFSSSVNAGATKGLLHSMISEGTASTELTALAAKGSVFTLSDFEKIYSKGSTFRFVPSQSGFHQVMLSNKYYNDEQLKKSEEFLASSGLDFNTESYVSSMNSRTALANPYIVVNVKTISDL